MALDIDKVYRFAKFVSNKENRGWIAPSEFNIAAEISQIMVYSRMEAMFLSNKKIHSDMRPFLDQDTIADATPRVFPTGFRQLISARITATSVPVVELTQAEYNDIANSTFLAPSATYPNCVVRSDGIQVYPAAVTDGITVEFIKNLTTTPTWAYTSPSGRPVYDSGNSTQFEFEDNLFIEIASYILMHIGVNIKDEAVTQYGLAFNSQK